MSETADYDPGCWKGHDFTSARRTYDKHVGRSYDDAVKSGKKIADVLPESITTDSPAPLVILCDVTGSMGEWPAAIFSKLPYLELEGQEYLGKDMEICWGAIGDAFSDKYPVQMRPFTKGVELKDELKKLVIEGGGGGGARESYELAALYAARNISMPKAVNPICIIIGDEGFYETINKEDGKKYAHASLEKRANSNDIFQELMSKYSVYLVRKHYGYGGSTKDGKMTGQNLAIHQQWEKILGPERVLILPEANRVVDVIFGILAKETDRVEYFREELTDRQSPEQVETVMKSLETVHKLKEDDSPSVMKRLLRSGKSVMKRKGATKKTKSLL